MAGYWNAHSDLDWMLECGQIGPDDDPDDPDDPDEPGPEDEFESNVNGDPDSTCGDDDESGFDDMPAEGGWLDDDDADEGDEDDE